MDNYYKFPWTVQPGTYRNGDKRLSVLSSSCGFIADTHQQTAHSNENDWKAITTLMAIAPELLAVAKAVAEGKVTQEVEKSAKYLVELIDVKESDGFDFWDEIDQTLKD